MKKLKLIGIILSGALIFTGCGGGKAPSNTEEDKVQVITSFYAMKALAEEIGGEKVQVESVIGDDTEPHDFEPRAKDLKAIEEADLFIYNGAGMEEWVEDVKNIINSESVIMVEASKDVELLKIEDDHEEEAGHEEEAEEHSHGDVDPHTWLGLTAAKVEGNNIKEALIQKDPKNSAYYEENYKSFEERIDNILSEYVVKFNELENHSFITGHGTFGYLCRDLGLQQESIEGVFAEGEPSPKELEELIKYCKEGNIKTIFVERLISPALSETLAREVGAETKEIYTLHGNEGGKTFTEVMEYNVKTIFESLSK